MTDTGHKAEAALQKFALQKKSWGKLRRIRPSAIDLVKIEQIRTAKASIFQPDGVGLEDLILDLGLNDDGLGDFPESLRPHCGHGLLIWQYPREFSRYLLHLGRLGVKSYVELGVRHGGTFVTTVECLARQGEIERALAIDIMPCPSIEEYIALRPEVRFARVNTQSREFARVVDEFGPFDAAMIDANHDEEECQHEFEILKERCPILAFHDVANREFPDVAKVWKRVLGLGEYLCYEYLSNYPEPHLPMGIGLAVRKTWAAGRALAEEG